MDELQYQRQMKAQDAAVGSELRQAWNAAIEACVDCVAENEPENILVIVQAMRALKRAESMTPPLPAG